MNLNIRKPGIKFTANTAYPIAHTRQPEKQKTSGSNLTGEPPKDIFVKTEQTEPSLETPVIQPPVVETVNEKPVITVSDEEEILIKELKKKAQKGKLKPPTDQEKQTIMALPINDGFKNDLHGLFEDTERSKDPVKYNKGIQEIFDKYGIAS